MAKAGKDADCAPDHDLVGIKSKAMLREQKRKKWNTRTKTCKMRLWKRSGSS